MDLDRFHRRVNHTERIVGAMMVAITMAWLCGLAFVCWVVVKLMGYFGVL